MGFEAASRMLAISHHDAFMYHPANLSTTLIHDLHFPQAASNSSSLLLVVCLITVTILSIHRLKISHDQRSQFPILGDWRKDDLPRILRDQFARNRDQVYQLRLPTRLVHVVPREVLPDYGWAPEGKVTSSLDLHERAMGKWTTLGSPDPTEKGDRMRLTSELALGPLTKQQSIWLKPAYEEIRYCLDRDLGSLEEWKSFQCHPLAMGMAMRVYQRLFVGTALSRDEKWAKACLSHATTAIVVASKLSGYPAWLRGFVAKVEPTCRQLVKHRQQLEDLVRPHYFARIERLRNGSQPYVSTSADLFGWYYYNAGPKKQMDIENLVGMLICSNFAAVFSGGQALAQALFDIAARPEYVQPLLDEYNQAVEQEGTMKLSSGALDGLVKLDSFLKESSRFHHTNLLSVWRKIQQPTKMTNGEWLPANSYVAVPGSLHATLTASGDETTFDGFQWAERRKSNPSKSSSMRHTSSHVESLDFGYGSHACPGRFFASNVTKAQLMHILTHYEIRLPEGGARPKPAYNNLMTLMPDKTGEIQFRRRTTS